MATLGGTWELCTIDLTGLLKLPINLRYKVSRNNESWGYRKWRKSKSIKHSAISRGSGFGVPQGSVYFFFQFSQLNK